MFFFNILFCYFYCTLTSPRWKVSCQGKSVTQTEVIGGMPGSLYIHCSGRFSKTLHLLFLLLVSGFQDRFSLCGPDCPGTQSVDPTGHQTCLQSADNKGTCQNSLIQTVLMFTLDTVTLQLESDNATGPTAVSVYSRLPQFPFLTASVPHHPTLASAPPSASVFPQLPVSHCCYVALLLLNVPPPKCLNEPYTASVSS